MPAARSKTPNPASAAGVTVRAPSHPRLRPVLRASGLPTTGRSMEGGEGARHPGGQRWPIRRRKLTDMASFRPWPVSRRSAGSQLGSCRLASPPREPPDSGAGARTRRRRSRRASPAPPAGKRRRVIVGSTRNVLSEIPGQARSD